MKGQAMNILLVDDHEDTNRAMKRLLERFGYSVETATSVTSALAVSTQREFDVLISDIGLPDGSGCDLMRELLAKRNIKGVALSGFGMDDDIRASREAGFVEHLTKPVNVMALKDLLDRLE